MKGKEREDGWTIEGSRGDLREATEPWRRLRETHVSAELCATIHLRSLFLIFPPDLSSISYFTLWFLRCQVSTASAIEYRNTSEAIHSRNVDREAKAENSPSGVVLDFPPFSDLRLIAQKLQTSLYYLFTLQDGDPRTLARHVGDQMAGKCQLSSSIVILHGGVGLDSLHVQGYGTYTDAVVLAT